jgi:ribosomal protein L37AE/L43A
MSYPELFLGVLLGVTGLAAYSQWRGRKDAELACPFCGMALRRIKNGRRQCEGCGRYFRRSSNSGRAEAFHARRSNSL